MKNMLRPRVVGFSLCLFLLFLVAAVGAIALFAVGSDMQGGEKKTVKTADTTVSARGDELFTSIPRPELRSRAAALYEYTEEKLLFEKNADKELPPASMTKLMTLHLAYEAIENGRLRRKTKVRVDEKADFRGQMPGSSLMFIEKGQQLSVLELMRGLAVPSGNDAAVALAQTVSGSVEAFVEEMNAEARRLGFEKMHFVDPAGIRKENRVTAREFGRFCIHYLKEHPSAIEELHNVRYFTYPKEENVPVDGDSVYGPIRQENYNLLVGRHPWVDGLKTGYIEASGYNISVTAAAEGRRLVAVVLGGPGDDTREGNLSRVIDGTHLISYGFYAFRRIKPEPGEPDGPRVWRGAESYVQVDFPEMRPVLVPARVAASIEGEFRFEGPLIAPVEKGERVGKLRITNGFRGEDRKVYDEYPLSSANTIGEGSLLRSAVDSLKLGVTRIVGN